MRVRILHHYLVVTICNKFNLPPSLIILNSMYSIYSFTAACEMKGLPCSLNTVTFLYGLPRLLQFSKQARVTNVNMKYKLFHMDK